LLILPVIVLGSLKGGNGGSLRHPMTSTCGREWRGELGGCGGSMAPHSDFPISLLARHSCWSPSVESGVRHASSVSRRSAFTLSPLHFKNRDIGVAAKLMLICQIPEEIHGESKGGPAPRRRANLNGVSCKVGATLRNASLLLFRLKKRLFGDETSFRGLLEGDEKQLDEPVRAISTRATINQGSITTIHRWWVGLGRWCVVRGVWLGQASSRPLSAIGARIQPDDRLS